MRRASIGVVVVGVAVTAVWLRRSGISAPLAEATQIAYLRPNIVLIVTDDQRYDSLNPNEATYMPFTYDFFTPGGSWPGGIWFDQAYVTTPLCCPSRASILTGMYALHHGVMQNDTKLTIRTLAKEIQEHSSYYTGLVGKYLNSWYISDGSPPGFNYWVTFEGGGVSDYFNYPLWINGQRQSFTNRYITNELRDRALTFLNSVPANTRFLLLFTPNAPHEPAQPATIDAALYSSLPPYRPPSWNEADVSDKPLWLQGYPLLTPSRAAAIDAFRLNQLRSLRALDRAVEAIINKLVEKQMMDNTIIIFLSDNGVFLGEHRLEAKRRVYEEAIRVPFAVYYPLLTPTPRVEHKLVANIDIAPTLYELTGVSRPPGVDGQSLLPLLMNPSVAWRSQFFIEADPKTDTHGQTSPSYSGVHTDRYVYVETQGDRSELYDLSTDPYQLQNQVDNPAYATIRDQLSPSLHSRCHILTAAFGRPDHPVIQTLWQLHHRLVGAQWDAPWHQAYLRWYDRVGPQVAAWVQERAWVKTVIRVMANVAARVAQD